MSNNIYFVGVARVEGRGIVVASYNNEADIDLAGVKQVLEQPNMNMQPAKHYSFTVGADQAWHLIAGECHVNDEKERVSLELTAPSTPAMQ